MSSGQTTYQRQLQGEGKLQVKYSRYKNKDENAGRKRDEGDQIDSIFGFHRYKKVHTCGHQAHLLYKKLTSLFFMYSMHRVKLGWDGC